MNQYEVLINVNDIFLSVEGKTKLMGYYQLLLIEAASEVDAESKALEKMKNDSKISEIWVKEKQKKPPTYSVEEINLVKENSECKDSGKTFYNAKKWWKLK